MGRMRENVCFSNKLRCYLRFKKNKHTIKLKLDELEALSDLVADGPLRFRAIHFCKLMVAYPVIALPRPPIGSHSHGP